MDYKQIENLPVINIKVDHYYDDVNQLLGCKDFRRKRFTLYSTLTFNIKGNGEPINIMKEKKTLSQIADEFSWVKKYFRNNYYYSRIVLDDKVIAFENEKDGRTVLYELDRIVSYEVNKTRRYR